MSVQEKEERHEIEADDKQYLRMIPISPHSHHYQIAIDN